MSKYEITDSDFIHAMNRQKIILKKHIESTDKSSFYFVFKLVHNKQKKERINFDLNILQIRKYLHDRIRIHEAACIAM
jgi:hypothetical protein